MSTVRVTYAEEAPTKNPNIPLPIPRGAGARSEVITSGASAATAGALTSQGTQVCYVYADAAVWLAIGTAPVAEAPSSGADDSWYVPASTAMWFWVEDGQKVSVIDA